MISLLLILLLLVLLCSLANNVETENNDVKNEFTSENVDKGKSILGAPPKFDKKEIKNPRVKKGKERISDIIT